MTALISVLGVFEEDVDSIVLLALLSVTESVGQVWEGL